MSKYQTLVIAAIAAQAGIAQAASDLPKDPFTFDSGRPVAVAPYVAATATLPSDPWSFDAGRGAALRTAQHAIDMSQVEKSHALNDGSTAYVMRDGRTLIVKNNEVVRAN